MRMDDVELKAIISRELDNAVGYDGGTLSTQRRRLLELYEGAPLGNIEDDTRSRVVSRNCMEAVEWSLPALLRIFTASNKLFEFKPIRPDANNTAKAATDYVNFVFFSDNRGKSILNMWFKTALIQRVGYLLVHWIDPTYQVSPFTGLSDLEFQALISSPDVVDIFDHQMYPDPNFQAQPSGYGTPSAQPQPAGLSPDPTQVLPSLSAPILHDVKIKTVKQEGRVKIEHLPPEQVLVSRLATDTVLDGNHFVAYRELKTVSQLREMGFDEELIQEAKGATSSGALNSERIARYYPDEGAVYETNGRTDDAMQDVWIECNFIRVDYDGDGIAELRYVVTGANGQVVLSNEEIPEVPIIALCPIPMPFRHVGQSVVDLVADLQELETVIMQQTVDSLFLSNNPRLGINELAMSQNSFDDIDNNVLGSPIRVRGPIQDALSPVTFPFVGQASLPVIQYIKEVQAERTGISPSNNGLDPDDLNVTAAGISMKMAAANQRIEYIARVFQDQIEVLGARILGLITRNQQEARLVRITGNTFAEFDPRNWHESYDVTCVAALGTGDKSQVQNNLATILKIQQGFAASGLGGPEMAQYAFDVANALTEAMGFRQQFFPDHPPAPQSQAPSLEMQKAQQAEQIAQIKLRTELMAADARAKQQEEIDDRQAAQAMALEEKKFQHQMALKDREAELQLARDLRMQQHREAHAATHAVPAG
jgi:hypothetical protein